MMADLTEEGLPHRFELFHTVDGHAERMHIERMKEGSEAGDIAQILYDTARHDADTRNGGHQRYTVALFRSESQSEPEVQFPFRIQPRAGSSWSGGDTEQPTERGERAQVLRIQNEGHALIMRMADAVGGRLTHALDKERERSERLERELQRRNLEFEDLQDRRMDREVERAGRLMREKMMGDLVGSLLPLAPLIVGQVISRLGKKPEEKNGSESKLAKQLAPTNKDAEARLVLLQELFGNMTNAEQQSLVEALKPLHKMGLVTLIQQAGGADSELERRSFDAGMQKLMKDLGSEEVMGIMAALDQANRNRFLAIYQSYGKSEEQSQDGMPDLLKDQPPAPEKDDATN